MTWWGERLYLEAVCSCAICVVHFGETGFQLE